MDLQFEWNSMSNRKKGKLHINGKQNPYFLFVQLVHQTRDQTSMMVLNNRGSKSTVVKTVLKIQQTGPTFNY